MSMFVQLYGVSQTIMSAHVDSSVSGRREKLYVQSDMNLHTAVISGLSGKLDLMDQSCVIFFSAQVLLITVNTIVYLPYYYISDKLPANMIVCISITIITMMTTTIVGS